MRKTLRQAITDTLEPNGKTESRQEMENTKMSQMEILELKKYSNQNKTLSGWARQQMDERKGRISTPEQ